MTVNQKKTFKWAAVGSVIALAVGAFSLLGYVWQGGTKVLALSSERERVLHSVDATVPDLVDRTQRLETWRVDVDGHLTRLDVTDANVIKVLESVRDQMNQLIGELHARTPAKGK